MRREADQMNGKLGSRFSPVATERQRWKREQHARSARADRQPRSGLVSALVCLYAWFVIKTHSPVTMTDIVTFVGSAATFATVLGGTLTLIKTGGDAVNNRGRTHRTRFSRHQWAQMVNSNADCEVFKMVQFLMISIAIFRGILPGRVACACRARRLRRVQGLHRKQAQSGRVGSEGQALTASTNLQPEEQ